MGNQVFEPDWIEGGFYGQVMTGGIYIGWNDDGLALGGFHQISAVVGAYSSAGVIISWSGIKPVWGTGAGAAWPPTGLPSPVTGALWANVDGTATAQVGTGWTDLLEVGTYQQAGGKNVAATALNSATFWDTVIQDVQNSNAPSAVKAAILDDLVMAREMPSYREEIAKKYGLLPPVHCFPSFTPFKPHPQTQHTCRPSESAIRF
jgi:hypothetical protein